MPYEHISFLECSFLPFVCICTVCFVLHSDVEMLATAACKQSGL